MSGSPSNSPAAAPKRWRAETIEWAAMAFQMSAPISDAANSLLPPKGSACQLCAHAMGIGTLCTGLCDLSDKEALAALNLYSPVRPREAKERLFSWFTNQPTKLVQTSGPNGALQTRIMTPMRREWLERQLDLVELGLTNADHDTVTAAMVILRKLSFDVIDLEQMLGGRAAENGQAIGQGDDAARQRRPAGPD